jgi:hypothetical protein
MEGEMPLSTEARQSRWARLRSWLKNHKKVGIVGTAVVAVLALSVVIWFGGANTSIKDIIPEKVTQKEAPPPTELPSLLNGVILPLDLYNRHPVAVMIENSQAARPQTGLGSADVVYEMVTEGGITRFMAVFSSTLPEKAGPVRSARSYFIDYLSEYDAFYAHAGGSPTALARIGQYGIKAYPHSSDAYWREPRAGVASEHTLFTDVSKIFKFGVEKRGWPATADFQPWLFKDPSATPSPVAAAVNIKFSSAPFNVVWNFDPATNSYSRVMAGVAHKDAVTGEQITARTIVALSVTHSPNPPYSGTGKESEWAMATIGEGTAAVFEDGHSLAATWKKPSRTERTRFFDGEGKEILLNRGKIWVEVVPQEGSYSQS